MICPTCSAQIPDGAQFCTNCGNRFAYEQPAYGAAPHQPGYPPGYGHQGQQPPATPPQPAGYGAQGVSAVVEHAGSFALAVVSIAPGQAVQAEAGAMVGMSANIELQSQMKGGLMGALKRAVVGESAFVSTFIAHHGPGEVMLAPPAPGDIAALTLQNQSFFIQGSSFLAAAPTVAIDTKFGGGRSFFSGEGLFLIHASGSGLLLIASFGALRKKTLRPGEQYIVDTGHIVAFESSIQYQLQKATKGFFRSITSGEGLVAVYTGPGDIYIQTRNLEAFAGILKPFFPTQGSGGGGFSFGQ